MSLLIKDMDMPKHAVRNGTDDTMYRSCVLVHPNGTAELVVDLEYADQFNFEHNLKRFPLTEIPTPHGDLIDRDTVLCLGNVFLNDTVIHKWAVIKAPAIIKEEE